MTRYGENTLEPEQFLHEALGFIAFIVPFVLIVVAAIVALTVAGFVWFIAAVAKESRDDRKKVEQRKALRLQRDQQRIAARNSAYMRGRN